MRTKELLIPSRYFWSPPPTSSGTIRWTMDLTQPLPSIHDSISDVSAVRTATTFQWQQVIELGYIESSDGDGANVDDEAPVCFHCGKGASDGDKSCKKLLKCARCHVASYWWEVHILVMKKIILSEIFQNKISCQLPRMSDNQLEGRRGNDWAQIFVRR